MKRMLRTRGTWGEMDSIMDARNMALLLYDCQNGPSTSVCPPFKRLGDVDDPCLGPSVTGDEPALSLSRLGCVQGELATTFTSATLVSLSYDAPASLS